MQDKKENELAHSLAISRYADVASVDSCESNFAVQRIEKFVAYQQIGIPSFHPTAAIEGGTGFPSKLLGLGGAGEGVGESEY
jgi:hypothetical protein